MWLPNLEGRRGPVYRRIADAIDEDVQKGSLRAGARLPPHRDMADHLGVTVTTVTRAYTEAARRGLISGHVGRGTFIRGQEPEEPSGSGPIDLSINILMPDKEVAALEPRMFQRRVLPWTELLGYVPTPGHRRHRQAMAEWLAAMGTPASPDRIVLTTGAQHALLIALAVTTKPGDTVLAEELTYSGMKDLAQPDASQAARRRDGRRRASPRCARGRMPLDPRARALLHAAAAEPDVGGDVGAAPPPDRRDRREVPADGDRGRRVRVPLARARVAVGADSGSHDLRHERVEEPVSRACASAAPSRRRRWSRS